MDVCLLYYNNCNNKRMVCIMITKLLANRLSPVGSRFSRILKCRNIHPAMMSTDTFLSNSQGFSLNFKKVLNYIENPVTSSDVITDRIGDYRLGNLRDNKISEILELCGDDLNIIDQVLGLYGLAAFAEVKPEVIIKNRNPEIREIGYDKDCSFRNTFYSYLLANDNGSLDDLYSRFGKMGAELCEYCSMLGFVKTGYGHSLTGFGKDYLRDALVAIKSNESYEHFKELFDE